MSIKVKGTVERRDIGMGAWAFVGEDGKTYEIMRGADKSLLQAWTKSRSHWRCTRRCDDCCYDWSRVRSKII